MNAIRRLTYTMIVVPLMGTAAGAAFAGDTHIVIESDTPTAVETQPMSDFDFELQQREREILRRQNIEDARGAVKAGDAYFARGEIDDAIDLYQIAIKMDPNNAAAHEKYIHAREVQKGATSPHYYRAMEYYRKGLGEKAVDELVLEIKENPGNEAARIKLNEIEGR